MKRKSWSKSLAVLLTLAMIMTMFTMVGVGSATAENPQRISGNDPGSMDSCKIHKFDSSNNDTYTDANDPSVSIAVYFTDGGKFVDWVSTTPITHVFVKGGNAGYLYSYDNAYNGEGLRAPDNKGGNQPQISHVTFYNCDNDIPESTRVVISKKIIDVNDDEILNDSTEFTATITGDLDFQVSDEFSVSENAIFHLLPGIYEIAETSDNDYEFIGMTGDVEYDLEEMVWWFEVTGNEEGSINILVTNKYVPDSDPETVSLVIYKAFADQNGNNAEKFKVTLTPIEPENQLYTLNTQVSLQGDVSVDEELTFTNNNGLSMNTGYIIEEDPNDCELDEIIGTDVSYNEDEERWEVWIEGEGTYSFTIVNKCEQEVTPKGKLIVKKVINNGGSSSRNFNFTVTPDEGSAFTDVVSVNQQAEIDLAPGWYTISENTLPANYSLAGYNPSDGRVEVVADGTVTVIITNNYTGGGGGGDDPGPPSILTVDPEDEEFEITPQPAAVEPQATEVIEIEFEPELPKTGGADILLLGLGAVIAGGGLLIRRKRK